MAVDPRQEEGHLEEHEAASPAWPPAVRPSQGVEHPMQAVDRLVAAVRLAEALPFLPEPLLAAPIVAAAAAPAGIAAAAADAAAAARRAAERAVLSRREVLLELPGAGHWHLVAWHRRAASFYLSAVPDESALVLAVQRRRIQRKVYTRKNKAQQQ